MIEHLFPILCMLVIFGVVESYAFYTRKYGKAAPAREYTVSEGVWYLQKFFVGRMIVWGFLAWINTHFLFNGPGWKWEIPALLFGMFAAVIRGVRENAQ